MMLLLGESARSVQNCMNTFEIALQATPRRRKTPQGDFHNGTPGSRPLSPTSRAHSSPLPAAPLSRTPKTGPSQSASLDLASEDQKPWPKLGTRVDVDEIKAATKKIFGYEPRAWQLRAMEKILEGHDVMTVAGTGAGKSLVFALIVIAAALANVRGIVIVVCPLKALQNDQVRGDSMCKARAHSLVTTALGSAHQHGRDVDSGSRNSDGGHTSQPVEGVYECRLRG